jgi:hypothetical protein
MGSSGNGDGWSDGVGPPEGLPDLPPDWGPIVIPEDAAELAAEAAQLRRELRRDARRAAWRRRLGLPTTAGGLPTLRLPLLLMLIAIMATLTSLFAVIWPGPSRQSGGRTPTGGPVPSGTPGRPRGNSLPALDLIGEKGDPVSLRGLLPAVIILVDGCDCADEIDAAGHAVPPGVTVVALTSGRTSASPLPALRPPAITTPIRTLADPTGELRAFLQMTPRPGAATVLLAARSGEVTRVVPTVGSVEDYRADLPQLATR